jgi:hypothetical protein
MGKACAHKMAESERPEFRKGDNYSTHYSLTELLFENAKHNIGIDFDFDKAALEPAAGEGHMSFVLKTYFNKVAAYDPVYGSLAFIKNVPMASNIDIQYSFLTYDFQQKFPYIITNPPFSIADNFVLRAKELEPEMFCFLLRTNYLSGQRRAKRKVYEGLAHVSVFDRMPDLRAPIREDGKFPTAMNVYAWFIWIKGYKGKPMFESISCSKYALKSNEMEPEYKKQLIELGVIKEKIQVSV